MVYDTVISVDYSNLISGRCSQSPDKLTKLTIAWSLVVESATQFARSISDQASANSYASAFLESSLVKQWMANEAANQIKLRHRISTPQVLIKYLLDLEDQGFSIFDDDCLKVHAKAIVSNNGLEHERSEIPAKRIHDHEDGGDQEMVDSFDCDSAAVAIDTILTDVGRKRKEGREDLLETRVKQFRYNCHEISLDEKLLPFSRGDVMNAGSR